MNTNRRKFLTASAAILPALGMGTEGLVLPTTQPKCDCSEAQKPVKALVPPSDWITRHGYQDGGVRYSVESMACFDAIREACANGGGINDPETDRWFGFILRRLEKDRKPIVLPLVFHPTIFSYKEYISG